MRSTTISVASTLVVLAAVFAACGSTQMSIYRGEHASDLRDAGSVHLSVLSVAPWSEYMSAMQPNFTLSADAALAKVAADSRWAVDHRANALQGGAQSVVIDRSQYGGGQPRELPSFRPPLLVDNGAAPGSPVVIPSAPAPGADVAVGPDAMLKYTAATALFQEVQLLNRYIRDAAIPNGYRPYMVRLQVSLMPSRRHAPYDTYTTISFFIPGDRAKSPEDGAAGEAAALASAAVPQSNSDAIFDEPFGNGPKVLPLLVTDNLEASVEEHSLERIRSLVYSLIEFPDAVAADQMVGGVLHDALRQQVLGRDLNSLLTIARLSENTLRIRIGAVQEATSDYAMVPRNHNITLLLMVPDGSPPLMEVVSRTQLVDAATSEALPVPDAGTMRDLYKAVLREQRLESLDPSTMKQLLERAERNDQKGFAALLRSKLPVGHAGVAQERSLWIALVSLLAGNQMNSHLFELPGQGEDVAVSSDVFKNQTVVIEDDGNLARVILREARFPEFERILATLSIADATPPILLSARSVTLDPARRELRVTFTSPQRLRLLAEGTEVHPQLKLSYAGDTQTFEALYRTVSAFEPDESAPAPAPVQQ
jgi:hypothetical protein